MKVIIAGSRTFVDYDLLIREIARIKSEGYLQGMDTIVSGCAAGADYLGELYAKDFKLKLVAFPANWDELGKAAGPIRNEKMAEYADALVAFWDGKSRGTDNMIKLMQARQKEMHIIGFKNE